MDFRSTASSVDWPLLINYDIFNAELPNIDTHGGAIALPHRFGLAKKSMEDEEVVVLSYVLDAPVNTGVEFLKGHPVDEFDGVKVRIIKHLSQLGTTALTAMWESGSWTRLSSFWIVNWQLRPRRKFCPTTMCPERRE
jgi:PDZ domain